MIKYTHFYDANNKLVATLATDHSNNQFRAGLAVVKNTEPIRSKRRGRVIATGRLNNDLSNLVVPNKVVLDHTGRKDRLRNLVISTINHSRGKFSAI